MTRNLIVAGGEARPVQIAEITASAFRIADGTPLLGRVLVADDERAAAPPVAVLGYDVWRTRFGSDPNVLGRTVQLGNDYATVVGVMQEGFAFPVSHELWTPFRMESVDPSPRSGPSITVFGLLAPAATLETAQAELTTLGRRAAVEQSCRIPKIVSCRIGAVMTIPQRCGFCRSSRNSFQMRTRRLLTDDRQRRGGDRHQHREVSDQTRHQKQRAAELRVVPDAGETASIVAG